MLHVYTISAESPSLPLCIIIHAHSLSQEVLQRAVFRLIWLVHQCCLLPAHPSQLHSNTGDYINPQLAELINAWSVPL